MLWWSNGVACRPEGPLSIEAVGITPILHWCPQRAGALLRFTSGGCLMFCKVVCAVFVMTVGIGLAVADEFNAFITKVDGDSVSFYRIKKGKKDDLMTLPAKDVKVNKGTQQG